jgi:hypothetical protein
LFLLTVTANDAGLCGSQYKHMISEMRLGVVFRRVLKIVKTTISFVMLPLRPSVCEPAWTKSAPIEQIFMKYGILIFFENLSRKLKFNKNLSVKNIKGIHIRALTNNSHSGVAMNFVRGGGGGFNKFS